MSEQIDAWLAAACADAERRGLAELKPLLESLARSTVALRTAEARIDARDSTTAPAPALDASASKPGSSTS